jgi:hypothetical protein
VLFPASHGVSPSLVPAMEATHYDKVVNDSDNKQAGSAPSLAPFDVSRWTRITNFAVVGAGAVLSLVCIATSIINITRYPGSNLAPLRYRQEVFEGISLVINLALTLTTESLAFIHSTSLRWALADEGQLHFNTNIRLLTTSRRSGPNRWWVNGLSLASLVLCYGASSILFVTSIINGSVDTSANISDKCLCCSRVCGNMIAVLALGIGLAIQTVVAAWCLAVSWKTKVHDQPAIPTWSSNPLNAALTGLWRGLLSHRGGRCMVPVQLLEVRTDEHSIGGLLPFARQESAWKVHRAVSYVVYLLWGLAVVAIVWPIIIAALAAKYFGEAQWYWTPNDLNSVVLAMSPAENRGAGQGAYFSFAAELVLGLLFVSTIQALQTIGLHCTELLVNISRDEQARRHLPIRAVLRRRNKLGERYTVPGQGSLALDHWTKPPGTSGLRDCSRWFNRERGCVLDDELVATNFLRGVRYLHGCFRHISSTEEAQGATASYLGPSANTCGLDRRLEDGRAWKVLVGRQDKLVGIGWQCQDCATRGHE